MTITRLSRDAGPAVHRYDDVPAESPDRLHILYTAFDSPAIPGPAHVVVADADGSNPRNLGACTHAIGHVGANPCWLDDTTIVYCPGGPGGGTCRVRSLDGSIDRTLKGQVRSVHEGTRRGILINDGGGVGGHDEMNLYRRMQAIHLWHFDTGNIQTLLTVAQAAAVHPLRDRFNADCTSMQNAKWSPDGDRLLVVFTDARYQHPRGQAATVLSLFVINADPDRPDPRYLGEFNDHPMWAPGGTFVIAHDAWEGSKAIVAYPADGGERYPLLTGVRSIHPSLNRAETHLLTDTFGDGEAQVLQYELKTGHIEVLASGIHVDTHHQTGSHPHPQYARDESCVFFNHAMTGEPQVYAVTLR